MRKPKQYTIDGHKKYKSITLLPVPNSPMWLIHFDGKLAYGPKGFKLEQALEHVETWRKQYVVTEVGGHVITTPMPTPEDVAVVLGNGKANVKQMRRLAKRLSGKG